MGLLKDEWNSTAFFKIVQGNNYPYTALKNAYNTMDAKGNTSGNMNTSLVFNWNNLRYPGRHSNNIIVRAFLNTSSQIYKDTFDGLAPHNQNVLNNIYSLEYMPRLCPVMQSAKTVAESIRDSQYYSAQYHVEVKRSYAAYSPSTSGYYPELHISKSQPISDFIDALSDDDLCVFSYKIYENKSTGINGIISNWNASSGVVYDTFTPMMFKATATNPGNFNTGFTAYLSSVLPPNMSFSPIGDMRWVEYDSTPYGLKVACFANIESGIYSTSNQSIIYGSKAAWIRFFDKSGFEWSFDEKVVQDPDSPDIRKPIEPGQPDNPEDDKDGDGDNESDEVEYPIPGYVPNAYTRYWLRPTDLSELKDFLFSQTFLNDIRRLWTDPGEYVVDCTFYPLIATGLGLTSYLEEIMIGNMNSGLTGYIYPDGVSSYHYGGGFAIEPYYNSYLDYEPYTTISIYIPYIGVRPLNASRITGHTLKLAYTFDFGTRQITAHLGLDGDMTLNGGNLGNALDQYTGSFGVSFPFSGSQNNQMVLNILQQSSKVISSAGAIAGGIATGNIAGVAAGVAAGVSGMITTSGHLTAETYGTLTPTAGLYSPQIPYLIINRPITAEPAGYKEREGYSAAYSGKVSSFTGFLKCATAEIPQAGTMTDSENKEIVRLLKEGVYL